MNAILNITSGDCAGDVLAKSGIPGEVFVWHDILYDGPRNPGWPDDGVIEARADFLERATGGGLGRKLILDTLKGQYCKLGEAASYGCVLLWFDACLFDQSMLSHILACLHIKGGTNNVELICVEDFPGIVPFNGLGQLSQEQMASVQDKRSRVTKEQFEYAVEVDAAFARQDMNAFAKLSALGGAPLPWVPAALRRWLQEQPAPSSGLGRLECLVLDAIQEGCDTPAKIFKSASANDDHPQYWGDTTLWAKINGLADRKPPLLCIDGPAKRLPLWEGLADISLFRISAP